MVIKRFGLLAIGGMLLSTSPAWAQVKKTTTPTKSTTSSKTTTSSQTTTSSKTTTTAAAAPAPTISLQSLRKVPVPRPSNLSQFVADEAAAIRLGKALFWDMQVGSDLITACASCHFHAGADSRSKNQLSPGLLRVDSNGNPSPDTTFQVGGPNYTLKSSDYPFHKLKNIDDASSPVISDRNDVTSSQGVFYQIFAGLDSNFNEINLPQQDPVFRVGAVTTRRVEPRNSPSTINAVFNQRNFWDGRAVDIFNGVNPFGLRDKNAKVYYSSSPKRIEAVSVAINNASLASQAVGPLTSSFEMSSAGRTIPELARRLLNDQPLAKQLVHPTDSVLGKLSLGDKPGLAVDDYATMIRQAFRPEWWQSTVYTDVDVVAGLNSAAHADSSTDLSKVVPGHGRKKGTVEAYSQMELNFGLFFGLSVQLYESLLVSDQTPFDKYAEGNTSALTTQQQQGLQLFYGKAKCSACHVGAEFTGASVQHIQNQRLERMLMGDGKYGVYDTGFYNIAVRPTREDLGIGSADPFGYPLSESRLLSQFGASVYQQVVGVSPNLVMSAGDRVVANGAFKTPGLRNVELTGPYFHNGGQRTLLEVVNFYNRGGDFASQNIADLDQDITKLGLTNPEKDALVAFLKSLTDERVRTRKAPFDHPQLFITNGHVGDSSQVQSNSVGQAVDSFLTLPATGSSGGSPLPSFLQ